MFLFGSNSESAIIRRYIGRGRLFTLINYHGPNFDLEQRSSTWNLHRLHSMHWKCIVHCDGIYAIVLRDKNVSNLGLQEDSADWGGFGSCERRRMKRFKTGDVIEVTKSNPGHRR